MKIIEAMKKVKVNKEKIAELQQKIGLYCANLSHESPLYGDKTGKKLEEWLQACNDLAQDNVRLLVAIQNTNLTTQVTIELGGKTVTKTIAEWIWRRREYAALDATTWRQLSDRGLQGGFIPSSQNEKVQVTVVRHFDPEQRDKKLAVFDAEKPLIDSALEVINATTDLIEA